MKFNFKIQPFQTNAVEKVIRVFEGESFDDDNKYRFDKGSVQHSELFFNGNEFVKDIPGYSNHLISLDDEQLLRNINKIQQDGGLKKSKILYKNIGKCSIDVEMETGTGKTYVYIKTMFELNKHYGWSKFIVVVPSIAIREGVKKTFEMTQDHFME